MLYLYVVVFYSNYYYEYNKNAFVNNLNLNLIPPSYHHHPVQSKDPYVQCSVQIDAPIVLDPHFDERNHEQVYIGLEEDLICCHRVSCKNLHIAHHLLVLLHASSFVCTGCTFRNTSTHMSGAGRITYVVCF